MKTLILLCSLSFPLMVQAQEPRAVIVVEEAPEVIKTVVSDAAEHASEAIESNIQQTSEVTANIAVDAIEGLLSQPAQTEETLEQLPEQPADLVGPQTPVDEVKVSKEKLQQIRISESDSNSFTLFSPWAPKPLHKAPLGWHYVPVTADRSYPVAVQLDSGKSLQLSVTPYALVPTANTLQIREPGYEPELGYQQTKSVSAKLEQSTQSLKGAADSLELSIKTLSDLVNSLPK